jgi:4-amino-4-deoxy-L-arabinose transferase-like glycosyltransferase
MRATAAGDGGGDGGGGCGNAEPCEGSSASSRHVPKCARRMVACDAAECGDRRLEHTTGQLLGCGVLSHVRALEGRSHELASRSRGVLLGLGSSLALASISAYAASGYSNQIALLWLAALVILGFAFLRMSVRLPRVAVVDLVLPVALTAVFAPVYLLRLHAWPVQVGADELAVMSYARQYASQPHVDLFGVSTYFGHPAVLFVVWGKLGHLLGGVDLAHMRLLHAFGGVLTVGVSYAFFRQLLPRPWAVFSAGLLGLNHSFLMISRMAMRENTVVLVEVVALALLLLGLRKAHPFATFCGGVAAGVGFYVHFPGRGIAAVWAAFMLALAVWFRREVGAQRLLQLGAIAALGFALVATPYMISYAKAPASLTEHQRQSVLLYADGRRLQQQWVFASSELAGFAKNVEFGLTAFNRPIEDHAWIYKNPGHGFVDPLTGVLLWVGAGVVLVGLRRRPNDPWPLLGLAGFLVLWLIFAFVINEAPDYPRMLLTLPLVAYLATEGVRAGAALLGRLVRRPAPVLAAAVAGTALAAVGVWNGTTAWNYLRSGRDAGDDIGSTGRYVENHRSLADRRFYLAADDNRWRYYVWGNTIDRLRLFVASDRQLGGVIQPERLGAFRAAPPFAIFLNSDLWSRTNRALTGDYPQGRIRPITPDGRLLVFNVPRTTAG